MLFHALSDVRCQASLLVSAAVLLHWDCPKDRPSLGAQQLKAALKSQRVCRYSRSSKADPVNPVIQMLENIVWVVRIPQLFLESKRVWEILLSLVSGSHLCVIIRCDAALLGSWEQVWALRAWQWKGKCRTMLQLTESALCYNKRNNSLFTVN